MDNYLVIVAFGLAVAVSAGGLFFPFWLRRQVGAQGRSPS